ncbi:hypothetical protein CCY99_01065 [Helicobacter sp. 16-1353]|uniref:hypothetical protein n=1 Tax=Helicobacter sp. 16-1353 TaxID=2004996 RepID=UPI000DCDB12A|nr:hypothetical protein [Helicobacter sp. 16-1353]RAX55320.1 hypothetical protein CCY99_01065 [Helicobacter sp. 16-1353]
MQQIATEKKLQNRYNKLFDEANKLENEIESKKKKLLSILQERQKIAESLNLILKDDIAERLRNAETIGTYDNFAEFRKEMDNESNT